MPQSQLPLWIQYVQALGAPLLAGAVGFVGTWIALQQMRLARVKLQHDTYDRKFAVFVAVRSLLTVVAGLKRAPYLVDMRTFINEISAVPFMFDAKLAAYLKEIERRVYRAHGLNEVMNNLSDNDKVKAYEELQDHILWLSEQSDIVIEKFRSSLALE